MDDRKEGAMRFYRLQCTCLDSFFGCIESVLRQNLKAQQDLVGGHMRFINAPDMKQSTLRRFIALDGFEELLELFRLDCLTSHGNLDIYDFMKAETARVQREDDSLELPEPLVDGKGLISLGYKPGRKFTKILTAVLDAQLEGDLSTRKEAIEFIREEFPVSSRKPKQ